MGFFICNKGAGGRMNDDMLDGVVLEPKEELFAQDVARGYTSSAAYRNNYDASNMQANSVHSEAWKVRHKPEVSMRIDELIGKAADVAIVDTSMVLRGLLNEAENNEEGASHGARVAAWAHLGKHLGMFTDKVELSGGMAISTISDLMDDLADDETTR